MSGPGWGLGPWGAMVYGGGVLGALSGGPIPNSPPFDIYCVSDPATSILLWYNEVSTIGSPGAFVVLGNTQAIISGGGGLYSPDEAAFYISKSVPQDFTFEFTAKWPKLPPDFSDIINSHSYFGTFSPGGACVGLFFSQIGIAYAGSVHIDGSNTLVLDTPVQDLPNSQVLVSENEYWTIRIAVSYSTGTVYIYVTKTADLTSIGHQLRYVLPAIPSSSATLTPPSITLVTARGTLTDETLVQIDRICLGNGVLLPEIPPIADAGDDQAIQFCSILQLDGSRSFDPQGGSLTYKWRLIDAPVASTYSTHAADGLTYPLPIPTGYTNKLYSATLQALNAVTPIAFGDVVVVDGKPNDIVGTGIDGNGFYVEISGYYLPDNLSTNTAFEFLRQNGLDVPASVKPTFYPDVPGIFRFDLIVSNGALPSLASVVVANAVESVVAFGVTPDLSFIWNYLSDFWKLVEDTERITVFWQGLAQVAAAELLNLWQVDYAKSLRDIQRTFQRRWLHYDLLMQENPALVEVTSVRAVYGGIQSSFYLNTGIFGVSGTHLDLQLSTLSFSTVIAFDLPDPYSPTALQAAIQTALGQVDERVQVRAIVNNAGTMTSLRIDAPFPITVLSSSTVPGFVPGAQNAAPTGTMGAGVVGTQTYRVERSLQFLDIQPNDFLCIDGTAYRIARISDDPSDPLPFQRLTLLDPLPVPASAKWSIAGTVKSTDLDFWNGLCEQSDIVTYEVIDNTSRALIEVQGPVLGSSSALTGSLPVDATVVGAYLAQPDTYAVYLKSILRRRYVPVDPLVVDVPRLQEHIVAADDQQVLRRNVDYFFDTFRGHSCIRFITPVPADAGGPDVWQGEAPPGQLWAETSYLDNRPRIEGNFGIPAEFTLDNLAQLPTSVDYLAAVQGLWYSYFNGPTLFNLRVGTQILLGLPFAEVAGTIVEIRDDYSSTHARILIRDLADTTIVREYTYPAALDVETNPDTGQPYVVGDTVAQFAPLVTGVEVTDWVKNPTWFGGYLTQGAFFEVEKFFKFLVRVDSDAFNLPALMLAESFVRRIKPTYTYPLFVVLKKVSAEVTVSDETVFSGRLYLDDPVCSIALPGVSTAFDAPRASGGGYKNQFDHNNDPLTPPVYPNPNHPIVWAYDKQQILCPEDAIIGTACTTFLAPTTPPYDSIFEFDLPVYTSVAAEFSDGLLAFIPGAGRAIGIPQTVAAAGTLDTISLEIQSVDFGTPPNYLLVLELNAVPVSTAVFTLNSNSFNLVVPVSLPVVVSDVLTCRIAPLGAVDTPVIWESVLVTVGQAVSWAYDTPLPAGVYCVYKDM